MLIPLRTPLRRDFAFTPKNVFALNRFRGGVERPGNDTAAHEVLTIGQDEPTYRRNAVVIVENERTARLQSHFADFVDPKFAALASCRLERSNVDDVRQCDDLAFDILSYQLQPIARPDAQRFGSNPEYPGVNAIGFGWRIRLMRGYVTALDEDVIAQRDPDGFAG